MFLCKLIAGVFRGEFREVEADAGIPPGWVLSEAMPEDGQGWVPGEGWVTVIGVPPTPPVPTPAVVSMRQARLALLGGGLLDTVDSAVAMMPGEAGAAARIEWEYATEVRRDSALVQSLSGALGMTAEQLDGLFVAAAQL